MMSERHTGEPGEASHNIRINYPVSQSYIYRTPLVHDSPASRAQSSIEDLVPQTNPKFPKSLHLFVSIVSSQGSHKDQDGYSFFPSCRASSVSSDPWLSFVLGSYVERGCIIVYGYLHMLL